MPDDIQAPESRAIAEIRRAPLVVQDDVTFLFDTARFEQLQRLAGVMAACKTMPAHLKGSVSDCFRVASQAMRWQMDPFAICDKTYEVGGKLAYEGQLIAAVVNLRAGLESRLSYRFFGDPAKTETLGVCVAGKFRGEAEERTIETTWKAGYAMSKGARDKWVSQPEQQLSYFAVRVWARRHCPEIILGAYTPEEMFDDLSLPRDVTPSRPALPAEPEPQRQLAEPDPAPSYLVIDADGEEHEYAAPATVENALAIIFKDSKQRGRAALEAAAENNRATIALLPIEIAERLATLWREMATDADPFGLPPLSENSPLAQPVHERNAGGLGGPAPGGEPDQSASRPASSPGSAEGHPGADATLPAESRLPVEDASRRGGANWGRALDAATDERLPSVSPALGNRENAANASDHPQSDLLGGPPAENLTVPLPARPTVGQLADFAKDMLLLIGKGPRTPQRMAQIRAANAHGVGLLKTGAVAQYDEVQAALARKPA